MGLFDKIRRAVEPDDDAYEDYDVEDIYPDSEDGVISRPTNTQMGSNPYGNANNSPQQQPNFMGYNNPQPMSNGQGSYQSGSSQQQQQASIVSANPAASVVGGLSSSIEIKVVKAKEDFPGTAGQIAEHLMNGRAVLLNLEETTKEMARRLVDFSYGVVFAIHGNSKRVATSTFVLTPNNVNISSEQARGEDDSNKLGGMDRSIY